MNNASLLIKNLRLILWLLAVAGVAAACTSSDRHKPNVYAEPEPDHGLIYFYRQFDRDGAQVTFDVEENGRTIGILANGTFFYHQAKPGRQYYFIKPAGSESEEHGEGQFVQVKAGEKYFLRAIPERDHSTVRSRVFLTFESQAMPVLPGLTHAGVKSTSTK